jgi:hypothetical protein
MPTGRVSAATPRRLQRDLEATVPQVVSPQLVSGVVLLVVVVLLAVLDSVVMVLVVLLRAMLASDQRGSAVALLL